MRQGGGLTKMAGGGVAIRLVVVLMIAAVGGCATQGELGVVTFEVMEPMEQILEQNYPFAYYRFDERGEILCVLEAQEPASTLSQAVATTQMLVIRSFGQTQGCLPCNKVGAANMNVSYLAQVGRHVGVYRAAGLAKMSHRGGKGQMEVEIRYANLKLTSQSSGFRPPFTKVRITGRASAVYYPEMVDELMAEFERKQRAAEDI